MPQHNSSRILKIGLGIVLLPILAGVAAQTIFSNKVNTLLDEKVPESLNFTYGDVSTNVLLGKVNLTEVSTNNPHQNIDFEAQSVTISGLQFLPLLQNGEMAIDDITLESPKIVHRQTEKDTTSKKDNNPPSKKYSIGNLSIQNGSYTMLNHTLDSVVNLVHIDFTLSEIHFDKETAKENIPFTYGAYQLYAKKGYYNLSPLEFIEFQEMELDPVNGKIHQLALQSKYGKVALSKRLAVEHDHYNLTIDNIFLKDWDFGIQNDLPYFHLEKIQLQEPVFHVYRDKLVPDDTSHQKLYNQALRDLPLDLKIDSIDIKKGLITYQERLEPDVEPEKLRFTEIEGTVHNLHSRGSGMVTIDINAQLMGNGPFSLDWSFDPRSKSNDFLVAGTLKEFKTENISPFLKTNLNAEVKGTVEQMYFTISGNELESQGDMKMKYDSFEFTVLKKDRLGVNKLLTTVVNLFTKDGNNTDKDGFRHGNFNVARKQDKSFFNYLWINLQQGLVDTMTGRGKKREN